MADNNAPKTIDSASTSTMAMTDAEFDKWLPAFLNRYLKDRLEPTEILIHAEKFPNYIHVKSEPITDPTLASVIVAHVALRSQEKQAEDSLRFQASQAKTNTRLSLMFMVLVALSAIASLVQLFTHH
jgi:hypothetical protein